jgi:hypothetical protein
VSTFLGDLSASGSGRTDIYDDLGTGTEFGSEEGVPFSSPVVVVLNADGIAAIEAAQGGSLSVGGAVASPQGDYDFRFGYSGDPSYIKQLELHFALSDFYQVVVGAGQTLTAQTIVPASGPGQFGNNLDSIILLYDAMGNLVNPDVSTKDGVNAFVSYALAAGGTYYVAVAGANSTTGEYVLSVSVSGGSSSALSHADPLADDAPAASASLPPAAPMANVQQAAIATEPTAISTSTVAEARPTTVAPSSMRTRTARFDLALAAIVIDPTMPQDEPLDEALTWDRLMTSRRRSLAALHRLNTGFLHTARP